MNLLLQLRIFSGESSTKRAFECEPLRISAPQLANRARQLMVAEDDLGVHCARSPEKVLHKIEKYFEIHFKIHFEVLFKVLFKVHFQAFLHFQPL